MSEEIKEITLDDLKKQVADLTDAVRNIKEPNTEKIIADFKETLNAQVIELTKPKKDKNIEIGDKLEVATGKYRGMSANDMEFHKRACKALHVGLPDEFTKAMDSTTADYGDEWVPTLMDAMLWENWLVQSRVASLFRTITMPSNPFTLPIKESGMTIYQGSTENTATTASNPTTGVVTLTAGKLLGEIDFSDELSEDSILAINDVLRADANDKMVQAMDNVIINGDTTTGVLNINYYLSGGSNIGATNKVTIFNGLRHACLVDNTTQKSSLAAAVTTAGIRVVLALIGKYGTKPSNCALIADPWLYLSLLALTEVITVDKYGPSATILTGEIGKVHGVPIIPTEELGKTDTSGYVNQTTASNTKGSFVVVHTPSWVKGIKREVKMEADRDIQKQQTILVISSRMALASWVVVTSQDTTALGYNATI